MGSYARSEEKHNCKGLGAPRAQEMVIFLGACSGVVLGKVTVKTPSAMDALISSGYRSSR